MVRCILQGRVYETCPEEEEARDASVEESDGLGGGLKCMMNGVIYYPGMENVLEAEFLRELRAAARATKIIEDHFDHLGRPQLKIVYVDIGDVMSDTPSEAEEARKHIKTIKKAEKEREKRDGIPRPRLIFVKQDRDYWPGSEKDPEVMARRTIKELKAHPWNPDYKELSVAPLPEEEKLVCPPFFADIKAEEAFLLESGRLNFMRHFDPSMPGTKFILENMPAERPYVLSKYMEDPDLWKEWMRVSQLDMTPAVDQSWEEMDVCNTTG